MRSIGPRSRNMRRRRCYVVQLLVHDLQTNFIVNLEPGMFYRISGLCRRTRVCVDLEGIHRPSCPPFHPPLQDWRLLPPGSRY